MNESLRNPERVERMQDCMARIHTWNQVGNLVDWCRRDSWRIVGAFFFPIKVKGAVVDPRIVKAGDAHTEREFEAAFNEFERLATEATAEL